MKSGKLRLNLGCGKRMLHGYVNIDSKSFNHLGVHIAQMDVRDLQYSDGSVDEILAEFVLEHIPYHEVQETVWEWWRVLKVGGTLKLLVPDFDMIAREWLDNKLSREHLHFQLYCPVVNPNKQMPHLCTFDKKYLKELLEGEGFKIVSMVNIGTDVRVVARKLVHKEGTCR